MIIGNGDIASVLEDREDLLFFASGVSNSQETRRSEYQREVDLLLDQDVRDHIVYFSSLSVFFTDTPYTQHKLKMEQFVKSFYHWTIVRIGNITWGTNTHTLINHFKEQVSRGENLNIQDVYRYVIEKDEFLHWMRLIPSWNVEMNCPGRRMKVYEIIRDYVRP